MSLGIRLKKARALRRLTQQQLAELLGIKQQAIQRIEAGKVRSTTHIVSLAEQLDVCPHWLAGGPGNEPIPAQLEVREQNATYSKNFPTVPLLEWNELDHLSEIVSQDTSKREQIPSYRPVGNKAFAVRLKDDSMVGTDGKMTFQREEIVIADPNRLPTDGSLVIAKTPHLVFRQYIKDSEGDYLHALNSTKYPPIRCQNQVQILARIIERISVY